jgi:D-arabinose 1-dehydrogenase-like Zn-dependent alcohol dehydrogenase
VLSLLTMRAVQITRFGGPEVLEVVDLPEPVAGPGQKVYDVSTAGINYADTHPPLSQESGRRADRSDRRTAAE